MRSLLLFLPQICFSAADVTLYYYSTAGSIFQAFARDERINLFRRGILRLQDIAL
jgi:hypothetical protein